jgi:hypothetical protein
LASSCLDLSKQLDASLVGRVSWVIEEDIVKERSLKLFFCRFHAAQSGQPPP